MTHTGRVFSFWGALCVFGGALLPGALTLLSAPSESLESHLFRFIVLPPLYFLIGGIVFGLVYRAVLSWIITRMLREGERGRGKRIDLSRQGYPVLLWLFGLDSAGSMKL
jgi:hypothetical protein